MSNKKLTINWIDSTKGTFQYESQKIASGTITFDGNNALFIIKQSGLNIGYAKKVILAEAKSNLSDINHFRVLNIPPIVIGSSYFFSGNNWGALGHQVNIPVNTPYYGQASGTVYCDNNFTVREHRGTITNIVNEVCFAGGVAQNYSIIRIIS